MSETRKCQECRAEVMTLVDRQGGHYACCPWRCWIGPRRSSQEEALAAWDAVMAKPRTVVLEATPEERWLLLPSGIVVATAEATKVLYRESLRIEDWEALRAYLLARAVKIEAPKEGS